MVYSWSIASGIYEHVRNKKLLKRAPVNQEIKKLNDIYKMPNDKHNLIDEKKISNFK